METIIVSKEKLEDYKKEVTTLKDVAVAIKIKNDKQLIEADEMAVEIKKRLKKFEEFFSPVVLAAHTAHKAATNARNIVCDPLKDASKAISTSIAIYKQEQQKKIEEAERKARETAEKKEREKREKLEAQAKEAEESGNDEKAEDLREKKEEVYVAPRPTKTTVKTQTSVRLIWQIDQITDKSKVPDVYKDIDEGKLKRAKNLDPNLVVPGVTFRKVATGAVRTK